MSYLDNFKAPTFQVAMYAGPHALGYQNAAMQKATFSAPWDNVSRFEIDDSGSRLLKSLSKVDADLKKKSNLRLSDILQHDNLFQNYPDLKNVSIQYLPSSKNDPRMAESDLPNRIIRINPASLKLYGDNYFKSVLLHETQHMIQNKEKFNYGNTPTNLGQITDRNPGEIEAHDVQARMNYSPSQRKLILPYSDTINLVNPAQVINQVKTTPTSQRSNIPYSMF